MSNKIVSCILMCLAAMSLVSCHHSNQEEPENEGIGPDGTLPAPLPRAKRTILIYAIASNSLSSNLDDDMNEILQGAAQVDLDNYRLLIYKVQTDYTTENNRTKPELVQLVKTSSGYGYKTVAKYNSKYPSTLPERISTVISNAVAVAPADEYGIIFWSHSDAWRPSPTWTDDVRRSFGQDYDAQSRTYYYCETADLADAVPDGLAKFIWFDSCYMANIESAYEFRGKCSYYIGSCTELQGAGMPYDITLPILLGEKGDVVRAAKATFDYYNDRSKVVTMSVMDMRHIERMADASSAAYAGFEPLPQGVSLQVYSRGSYSSPLYDFGQYTRMVADCDGSDISSFQQALDDFVVYAAASQYDFRGVRIVPEYYSGLSCHLYRMTDSRDDRMYRTLDWYRRVYPNDDPIYE